MTKNGKEIPWIFMQISQIMWEIYEEKSLKIWGEKRKLSAGSNECSTSWWGNSTFSRNFVESLLKNPPWLHNDSGCLTHCENQKLENLFLD